MASTQRSVYKLPEKAESLLKTCCRRHISICDAIYLWNYCFCTPIWTSSLLISTQWVMNTGKGFPSGYCCHEGEICRKTLTEHVRRLILKPQIKDFRWQLWPKDFKKKVIEMWVKINIYLISLHELSSKVIFNSYYKCVKLISTCLNGFTTKTLA